jgi:hypothetical protein
MGVNAKQDRITVKGIGIQLFTLFMEVKTKQDRSIRDWGCIRLNLFIAMKTKQERNIMDASSHSFHESED